MAIDRSLDPAKIRPGGWILHLTCCGRDDGTWSMPTWEEADKFREDYSMRAAQALSDHRGGFRAGGQMAGPGSRRVRDGRDGRGDHERRTGRRRGGCHRVARMGRYGTSRRAVAVIHDLAQHASPLPATRARPALRGTP